MRDSSSSLSQSVRRLSATGSSKPASFVRVGEELLPLQRVRRVPVRDGERTEFYGEGGRLLATTFQKSR